MVFDSTIDISGGLAMSDQRNTSAVVPAFRTDNNEEE
jgi:hypothetical protein